MHSFLQKVCLALMLLNQFEKRWRDGPAGAVFRVLRVPQYPLVEGGVLRHHVCFVPGLVDTHTEHPQHRITVRFNYRRCVCAAQHDDEGYPSPFDPSAEGSKTSPARREFG